MNSWCTQTGTTDTREQQAMPAYTMLGPGGGGTHL